MTFRIWPISNKNGLVSKYGTVNVILTSDFLLSLWDTPISTIPEYLTIKTDDTVETLELQH